MDRPDKTFRSPIAVITNSLRLRAAVRTAIGALFCTSAGLLVVLLFSESPHRTAVPLVFIAVVTFAAARWGTAGAIVGLIAAAGLFAMYLFHPLGTLSVSGEAARANLGWMLLLGLPLAFLFAKPPALKR